jgi:hypothetical protein
VTLVLHTAPISRFVSEAKLAVRKGRQAFVSARILDINHWLAAHLRARPKKGNRHVCFHPGGALSPGHLARPRACDRFIGANSETGFGGEETCHSRSRRNARAKAIAAAATRMCDSRCRAEI